MKLLRKVMACHYKAGIYTICILFLPFLLYLYLIYYILKRKTAILFPRYEEMMEQLGENIKLARKRRKLTATQVAERANISRNTLYLLEKGKSNVSIAALFNVLRVLGLHMDILKLAADDELGRKLQDLDIL